MKWVLAVEYLNFVSCSEIIETNSASLVLILVSVILSYFNYRYAIDLFSCESALPFNKSLVRTIIVVFNRLKVNGPSEVSIQSIHVDDLDRVIPAICSSVQPVLFKKSLNT